MKRRDFLTASSAGLAAMTATTVLADDEPLKREFIEVRKYTVQNTDKRAQLVSILDKAFIPALNRQGLKPVGVFVPMAMEGDRNAEKYILNVFVVIPHKTTGTFLSSSTKLLADQDYLREAAPIFEATPREPVYADCETYLLHGFPTAPGVEVPPLGPDRVFQLRLYRSFNIERNAAKIKMFDKGGELPLFREVGLNPIFFGDVLAGNRMPALMYMIGCPSLDQHAEVWKTFIAHPTWIAIKDLPEYKGTATEIDRVMLKPSPGSQI